MASGVIFTPASVRPASTGSPSGTVNTVTPSTAFTKASMSTSTLASPRQPATRRACDSTGGRAARARSRDGSGDADRGRVLIDVPLVEPEQVELRWTGVAEHANVAGSEPGPLGEHRPSGVVEHVTAEDGAGPARR